MIRQRSAHLLARIQSFAPDDLGISTITVAELAYGAAKSQRPEQNQRALDQFLLPFLILPFDHEATAIYGRIRAQLERRGTPIGPLDLLIAAQAFALAVPLVSNNFGEFTRVPDLQVEDWLAYPAP